MAARLSALRTGRNLLHRNIIFLFLVVISLEAELSEPQGLVRPEEFDNLKKFIHLIGTRTRDLPACSIVP
jgi:hypothetical protein